MRREQESKVRQTNIMHMIEQRPGEQAQVEGIQGWSKREQEEYRNTRERHREANTRVSCSSRWLEQSQGAPTAALR